MFEFSSPSGNQIWLLSRNLDTVYIGAPVEGVTLNARIVSSDNIPGTNTVRFLLDSGQTCVYDYYYGQWNTNNNKKGVSSTIYQGLHSYINNQGVVFQETPGQYLDGSSPVLMSFKTGWIRLADLQAYQRAYFFYFLGTYLSPHQLFIQIAYDYSPFASQYLTITPQNFAGTLGQATPLGIQSPLGGPVNLEQWKIFFERQRCQAFQISINELFDPRYGTVAGPGLNISGIDCVLGFKKGYRPISASVSAG